MARSRSVSGRRYAHSARLTQLTQATTVRSRGTLYSWLADWINREAGVAPLLFKPRLISFLCWAMRWAAKVDIARATSPVVRLSAAFLPLIGAPLTVQPLNIWKVCRRCVGIVRIFGRPSTAANRSLPRLTWRPLATAVLSLSLFVLATFDAHAAGISSAAFTASTWWEVNASATAADANGGGFDTGVAGFPTDGAATSANTTAPVFSSASYTFVAGDVGHWVYIKSGTNWTAGFYKIASVSAGAATLTGTIGLAVKAIGRPSTVVGCATVASPTAATWGLDYSQKTASAIAFTDLVIDATTNTKFTSVAKPAGQNYVGNIINITSGTGFTVQRVAVVSVAAAVATCDKSLGTLSSTGGVGVLGGALFSPGVLGALVVAGNLGWIIGTHTVTTTSTNVTGGVFSNGTNHWVEGYQTIRGDVGTAPTIQAASSGFTGSTLWNSTASTGRIMNLAFDGVSKATVSGCTWSSGGGLVYRVSAANCTSMGIGNAATSRAIRCSASGCAAGFQTFISIDCVAVSSTTAGFNVATNGSMSVRCIAYNQATAGSDGWRCAEFSTMWIGCVAYGVARDGFQEGLRAGAVGLNCLAENNGRYGFNMAAEGCALLTCGGYLNPSGNIETVVQAARAYYETGFINATQSFFVDPANGDFRLNMLAGGGALARKAGYPGTFPGGLTTAYTDIGAAQSWGIPTGGDMVGGMRG